MKKILLSIFMIISVSSFTFGQNYVLNVQTGVTYTDLTGATSLTQGQLWDDPELIVPIGFDFPFWWNIFDTLYVGDGWCAFNISSDTVLAPYIVDMIDRGDLGVTSLSSINYKNETVASEKIFKLEYKNFGFFEEESLLGTLNWYGNLQLWLYESGLFEVRVGPTQIDSALVAFSGLAGPGIGFGEPTNSHWLTGQPSAPVLTPFNNFNIGNLDGVPVNGTVYQFAPYINAIPESQQKATFLPGPNPVQDILSFDLTASGTVTVYDLTGKSLMKNDFLNSGKQQIDVSSLTEGIYLVRFTTANGDNITRRIVKL